MDVQDVSLSTTCSLDVHWVSLSQPPTTVSLNAGMSDCLAYSQSGIPGMNKNSDAGTSPYRNKGTQSGTGMSMPAASTSMPMPNYAI